MCGGDVQGGLYHGRILLPAEYPFKPPAFLMLTPNGRFETGQKVGVRGPGLASPGLEIQTLTLNP